MTPFKEAVEEGASPKPFTEARTLALDLAGDLDRALTRAIADARALDPGSGLAFDLARTLNEAINLYAAMTEPRTNTTPRSAERLIHLESRLLPARHRGRYAEELRAELHDLARAKATRAVLLLYALQQLRRVWQLRAALEAPDRPRFHRLRRAACWVLAADARTWGLLGPLMAFAIVNVFRQQGWGSAFFTIPGIVAFYAGVEWLRKRWGVNVKPRDRHKVWP